MSTADANPADKPRRRFRLRFSLKAILILFTAACLWLGFKIARERRADALASRADSIAATILASCSEAPAGTKLIRRSGHPSLAGEAHAVQRYEKSKELLAGDEICRVLIPRVELDVGEALQSESIRDLGDRLLAHYEADLPKLGLRRLPEWAVWVSDRANVDTTVYVQVRVDADTESAFVQIMCVDRAQISYW